MSEGLCQVKSFVNVVLKENRRGSPGILVIKARGSYWRRTNDLSESLPDRAFDIRLLANTFGATSRNTCDEHIVRMILAVQQPLA